MERGANDWWPKFSRDEYLRRYEALRRAMAQRGDALMTELTGGYGGYFGKLYTTSFIGPPVPEYEAM